MKRILLAAAILSTAVSWTAVAQTPHADPARQYATCMAIARSEPRRAMDIAAAWEKAGGAAAARHCRAIAMLELGNHVEAGRQLEALAREMTGQSTALRAEILAQAGQAYQAARLAEQALAVQNAAILLDPRNAEIWIDRSITYAAVGAFRDAAADLTRALGLAPGRADILVMRAAASRQFGDLKAAIADADAALRVEPNSTDALLERGLARRSLGDRNGGDADLRKVLSLVPPASDQAAAARAILATPTGTPLPASPPASRRPAGKPR